MPDDLTKLKLAELREMARVRGIKPVFGVNKAQLIEKLQALDAEKKTERPAETAAKGQSGTEQKQETRTGYDTGACKSAEACP